MPPTEQTEVAGFTGTFLSGEPRFAQFDDGLGGVVPPPDLTGSRNAPIRAAVLGRLNGTPAYRAAFGNVFPTIAAGAPIEFVQFAQAIAEFEFTLVRANAPIDRFARGDTRAMTPGQKRGAMLFFGRAGCVECHAVSGKSNEMFSDFAFHDIAVPQIAPAFGVGVGNVVFDGPSEDEDFGLAQSTFNPIDRYQFRTSPLRNVALQPTFFHNGSYTRLDDAIRHHFDAFASARNYDPVSAGVAADLRARRGPTTGPLAGLDALLRKPLALNPRDFADLVEFVRDGLTDTDASIADFCTMVPAALPSGRPNLTYEDCAGFR